MSNRSVLWPVARKQQGVTGSPMFISDVAGLPPITYKLHRGLHSARLRRETGDSVAGFMLPFDGTFFEFA